MSDDALLNTSESYQNGDFDEYSIAPEGDHVVTIEKVIGGESDFETYVSPRATLHMRTEDNHMVFDQINLPHPQEKDGSRKRRAIILSKLGLISRGETNNVSFDWKRLEGMRCIITVEHIEGTSKKTGKKQMYANPTFAGYRALDGNDQSPPLQEQPSQTAGATGQEGATPQDDFSDI